MKGIITVLGHDRVGIIAKICTYLANEQINILDISQTIVGGYFNMVMVTDLSSSLHSFEEIVEGLSQLEEAMGLKIKLQREDIFNSMHRI